MIRTLSEDSVIKIKERTENLNRQKEKGIVNQYSGASISIKENGNMNISAGYYNQDKRNAEGMSTEICLQKKIYANRMSLILDEYLINNHKLNPILYEASENRTVLGKTIMRSLCLNGTAIVKTWDIKRKREVFIKRNIRSPMFLPDCGDPVIPANLSL